MSSLLSKQLASQTDYGAIIYKWKFIAWVTLVHMVGHLGLYQLFSAISSYAINCYQHIMKTG